MTRPCNFIILKAETYDDDGVEKFRFAAAVTDDSAPDVVFIFDEYALIETEEGIKAQCLVHFGEAKDDKIVLIEEDDPRYDQLCELGQQILKQVTEPCMNELAEAVDCAESFLNVGS